VGTADISTRKESEPLLADAAKGVNVRDEVILLAEDNADMAELFVRVLGSSGFTNEVVIVRDGVETLDWGAGSRCGVPRGIKCLLRVTSACSVQQ
jgi:hypothetical protein